MGAERIIHSFGHDILLKKGLRLGDELKIAPSQGRTRPLKLTFSKYIFKTAKIDDYEKKEQTIFLPELGPDRFHCELILCFAQNKKKDSNRRFLFRSLNSIPFRLNGILCFEAFLERDDRIDLGYNRIQTLIATKDSLYDTSNILQINNALIKSSINILIEGETGTGKSRLARLIHEESERHGKFIQLNISSLAPSLIESELFGHVKGAFTGALNSKKGALTLADGGTLFLDEIDSLPWDIQTKLLVYLDDQMIKAVGSEHSFKTNIRLIFASGRQLKELVQQKIMRQDFYFRISSGQTFYLPPIRNNPEFIKELCHQFEYKEQVSLSPKLIDFYKDLSWPGNIRQLLGHLQKKKIVSKTGHLLFDEHDELMKEFAKEKARSSFVLENNNMISLEKLKKDYINHVYNLNDRRLKNTADILQISSGTLRGFLKENRWD